MGVFSQKLDAVGLRSLMTLLEPCKSSPQIFAALNRIKMFKDDKASANAWRCQLMRMLDPITSGNANEGISLNEMSAAARKRASHELALSIMEDVTGMLARNGTVDNDTPLSKLQGILEQCASLSWTLWTQRHRIEILDIPELNSISGGNTDQPLLFHMESEYFEHHPQHNRELDGDVAAWMGGKSSYW